MVQMTFSDDMEQVDKDIRNCTRCRLHQERNNAVPGEGDHKAGIMLIGEAPGKKEDEQGTPFVGRAGDLLGRLLISAGLSRDEVYITNVVKCRPPDNRDPRTDEVKMCRSYLQRQMNLIQPKVIGTLGNHSTKAILDVSVISKIHGKKFSIEGFTVIPLYHPAAGLYNPNLVDEMKKDILLLASHK